MFTMPTETTPVTPHVRVLTLAASCLALFAIFLDNTIVNVAIPSIQHDLRSAPDELEWTVNAYVVAFAGLVLLGGKLGDRFGRRRMFVAGLLLFGVASAAGALAPSSAILIAARAAQGAGAALLAPLSLSLLAQVFRSSELPMAIGIWAGVSGLGLAIGPLLGGLLTQHSGWHAVFWVNVPIAALAAALTLLFVSESRSATRRDLDALGTVLVTVGLGLVVAGLAGAVTHPWTDPLTLTFLASGAVLLAGFVVEQMRTTHPLIPRDWLRDRDIVLSTSTLALVSFALFGGIFLVSLYLQDVRGYDPIEAGVRMLPLTLTTLFVAPLGGRLASRRSPRGVLIAGLVITAIAVASLTQLGVDSGYPLLGVRLAVLGVGFALSLPTAVSVVLNRVPGDRVGIASGLLTMSRQVGGALGLALLATLGGRVAADSFVHSTGLSALSSLVAGGEIDAVRGIAGVHVANAAGQAFVDGFSAAMWLALSAVLLSLLVAIALVVTRPHFIKRAAPSLRYGER